MIDPVPPKLPEPPSLRAEAFLRSRLAEMDSGEQLPPVAEIAAELGIARRTVSKVLAKLADEGLVRVWPSYGTFKT